MRTNEEVMKGITVYYSKKENDLYRIYMVQDNYSHSVDLIHRSLEYARTELGMTTPSDDDINIEILRGERYSRVMSIEFDSKTPPTKQGFELTKDSGLWEWLKY